MSTVQHIEAILKAGSFDPAPVIRDDDSVDYCMDQCQAVCYHTDNEGCYVEQCPLLLVTVHGMKCLK